jgi:hypothetical protein
MEPLERRVGWAIDDAFIDAWEEAIQHLATDTDAQLPSS